MVSFGNMNSDWYTANGIHLHLRIENLTRRCHITCFEAVLQIIAFFISTLILILKEDFDLSLGWYDVYLPILIADCLQVYHCFNCFIRYRLSIDPILHHSFVFAFGKRVLFTLLVGMAKYLFYYSMEEYQDPESRRYRTGSGICMLVALMFLAFQKRHSIEI